MLGAWLLFAVFTAFVVRVVFYGGADWLEHTFASALLINLLAPLLKAYVVFSWLANLAMLLLTQPA
jgi:hypothetical protein